MEKKIQIFLLNLYIALSFITAYQTKIRNSILVCLALVSFVNFLFFSKNFFKKNKNDLYVYLLFLLLIISLLFNFSISNMLYVIINIITIFTCMLVSKTHYIYIKKILEKQTIIFNYINLFLLSFFNITYKSSKKIFGYLIYRRKIDLINLSNISVWALLLLIFSIWSSKKKKNKIGDYLNILVAILLIFFSGKINIFVALAFIIFLVFSQKFIRRSLLFHFFILFSFFNSSLFFLILKQKTQKAFNVVAIATGRDKLWEDYFKFIFNRPEKILTGFSFYQDSVSFLKHPHNQYLI